MPGMNQTPPPQNFIYQNFPVVFGLFYKGKLIDVCIDKNILMKRMVKLKAREPRIQSPYIQEVYVISIFEGKISIKRP